MKSSLAIVGMACRYPDAATPSELWENVLARRRSFRRLPPERLRAADYVSSNPRATDQTYVARAALIEGWEFDRERFRVVGSTYRSTDPTHWLALEVAAQALDDAGFPDGEGLPNESTGVLVGNTLTGEFSRASVMRLRWPYVRRVVNARLAEEGWEKDRRAAFMRDLEARYKHPFPALGDETLAGGLSNTIAGRICNYFDLHGGGYTVDGACSSSLLSLSNACSALTVGDIDVAIVGGVDLSLDPFELVGFARLGALAKGEMRVYDAGPTGFLPGEGAGFVVLMREDEAVAQNRRIYALIRGWGISSDGKGGLTRPEIPGQKLALKRAYDRAGYGPDSVGYFEGHGTGTEIGDTVELTALSESIRAGTPPDRLATVGSVKANIGHCKAAAGLAGLLKASLALHKQTIPPNTGVTTPHPELTSETAALRLNSTAEPWTQTRPMRAGVSSMGFGGINVHVTLESPQAMTRTAFTPREQSLLRTTQDAELFLLGGRDREDLSRQVDLLSNLAPGLSVAEMADLAATLADNLDQREMRAAVVAGQPDRLTASLKTLATWLAEGVDSRLDIEAGVFLGTPEGAPRITYLFSGQAAPANLDGGAIRTRFEIVDELYDRAQLPQEGDGIATAVAQPAIATASMAILKVLTEAGISATNAIGNSLGELTALHWAGVYDEATYLQLAAARGRAMTEHCHEAGAMASVIADRSTVEKLLEDSEVVLAGVNAPEQMVVSGREEAVEEIIARAQDGGLRSRRLPVSHAFHSPLLAEAEQVLAAYLSDVPFAAINGRVISTIAGRELNQDDDLKALLCRQVQSPVLFSDAIEQAAAESDLFIELGPGGILAGLAAMQVDALVIATDAAGKQLRGMLEAVAAAFALGADLEPSVFFADRAIRPFDMDRQPRYLVNPCELAPIDDDEQPSAELLERLAKEAPDEGESGEFDSVEDADQPEDTLDLIRQLVAAKAELPLRAIGGDSRLLDDLHLNSITVSRIVVEAARRLNLPPLTAPNQFADATVSEVAAALDRIKETGTNGTAAPTTQAPGIDSWVRCLHVEKVEQSIRPEQPPPEKGEWHLFSDPEHLFASSLRTELEKWGGQGVIICLPSDVNEDHIEFMLRGARAAVDLKAGSYLVFVQHSAVAGRSASSLARTIHLEGRDLVTCLVDVPLKVEALPWVVQEVKSAVGFSEATYDADGLRRTPRLQLLDFENSDKQQPMKLTSRDLLLVSGGGKGIGAECAFAWAKKSGVRLALLGRAEPGGDSELAANLERLRSAGVNFEYYSADVTDADAVGATIKKIRRDHGEVTAFLHAAGTNVPQLIRGLDKPSFIRTLAPKLFGAENILSALNHGRLRLFISFGSIIARAGLRGEADYAVANEWLSDLVARFALKQQNCRCLSIEWSVWSGVGMGERLGRVQELARDGITAITPDQGMAVLDDLLACTLPDTSIVVTGRFGQPPTLAMDDAEPPLLRFLEKTPVHYPGIELIADAELTLDSDPYLKDHVFRGQRLLPAVMGMEAMAQAAMALAGKKTPPVMSGLRFERPVVLPEEGRLTIRLAALRKESGEVVVALRSEESSFAIDHFRAVCSFDEAMSDFPAEEPTLEQPCESVALEPARELYGSLLFHRGRFRRLDCYRRLAATSCVAEISADGGTQWFGQYLASQLVLGDPALADAAIHAIQVCVPDISLLPVGVERVWTAKSESEGPWTVCASEQSHQGDLYTYNVRVIDHQGQIVQRWHNLQLSTIAGTEHKGAWVPALLGPYVERKLTDLAPSARVQVAVENGDGSDRNQRRDRAVQRAAGESVDMTKRPDGKPELSGGLNLSVAHAENITLALTGETPVGCDAQTVSDRDMSHWQDLLGADRFALAETVARETGEDKARAATRVWTVVECLTKIGAPADAPIILDSVEGRRWVHFASGAFRAATTIETVNGIDEPLALAVMARCDDASV
ncbi:MAG: type I polyketide synthase [candidate division Zixibacteria bacterium]|nr:type I polyketide synthase [candidate division Zixibacteria bacterium]MDH4032173.1 type I polyketide synthase [candidate division Zixibacteria bacterium]